MKEEKQNIKSVRNAITQRHSNKNNVKEIESGKLIISEAQKKYGI